MPRYGPDLHPRLAGFLVGGNAGPFRYRRKEWDRLLDFIAEISKAWGTRWLVSTSRRTPDYVADKLAELAKDESVVARFIDYRTAGPGTLPEVFAKAEVILCTEDSSTMISEAVSARLPVVGVAPRAHRFTDEERSYRRFPHRQRLVPRAADRRADPRRLRPRALGDRAASSRTRSTRLPPSSKTACLSCFSSISKQYRHGRACPGHPRLRRADPCLRFVDARHKAGHDKSVLS